MVDLSSADVGAQSMEWLEIQAGSVASPKQSDQFHPPLSEMNVLVG
jgi:hypothetical protein